MAPKAKVRVSLEEVERLAGLSKLSMTRQEEERMRDDLSSILGYFQIVEAVTVAGTARPAVEAALLRADEVGPSDSQDALKGVPSRKGRLVKAPRVF